jgi:hypothetical protein
MKTDVKIAIVAQAAIFFPLFLKKIAQNAAKVARSMPSAYRNRLRPVGYRRAPGEGGHGHGPVFVHPRQHFSVILGLLEQ